MKDPRERGTEIQQERHMLYKQYMNSYFLGALIQVFWVFTRRILLWGTQA